MENAVLFSTVNINLTLVFRMIQRQSPLSIRLSRIKEYETPYGTSLKCMKMSFTILILYMGIPMSMVWGTVLFLAFMIYWYITIAWWHCFVTCQFKKCTRLSAISSGTLLFLMTFFFSSYPTVVYSWMVPLWWSCYTLYLSIWYMKSYVNTNLILS
jgi:hypothetical protein